MTALRTILATAALLALVPAGKAEDLLYVRTGGKLYTCDTQTGELTYLTDGTLQWIASPSFDEPHHTALYVVPGTAINKDGSYFYGNPVTGQVAGPYEATLSSIYPGEQRTIPSMAAYATSTERLYVVASDPLAGGPGSSFTPMMVDQYAGPPLPDWGETALGFGYEFNFITAIAYDPTRDAILAGWSGDPSSIENGARAIVAFDPHTGHSLEPNLPVSFLKGAGIIHSIAVDPSNGDLYYVDEIGAKTFDERSLGLYRNGQFIADTIPADASLRFADAKWAGLATPP